MLKLNFSLLVFIILALPIKAQNIFVTENYTDQQLIQKIFDTNSCLAPSNIKINGYTFDDRSKSYGYFTNNNTTFALNEGVIITTGKAKSAVGPNNRLLSEGPRSWVGDQDLEIAINESNTYNATSIEFEIEAVSSQFSFNYIFSSEQYLSNPASYQCNYSDGFAFLIKEIDNPRANFENIALIPDTDIPIKIPNVRAATRNCPESFPKFFGGFNGTVHPTNYNGQTVVLTAKANVTPGKKYKFKLVIADQGNEQYDSAIFLAEGSFKNSIDLGVPSNVKVCQNDSLFITPTPLHNAQYYTWYKDGIAITNHNRVASSNIEITTAGVYKLEAYINANCIITEEINVTYKPGVTIANETHKICQFSSDPKPFNIIANNNLGFNTNVFDYLTLHYSRTDALSGINAIPRATLQNFLAPNGTTVLYTRGYDYKIDCTATGTYTIISDLGTQNLNEQNICNYDGQTYNLAPFLPHQTTTNLLIFDNSNDADNVTNPINISNTANVVLKAGQNTLYLLYQNAATNCGEKYILKINVLGATLPDENQVFCEGDTIPLQGLMGFVSYLWSTGDTTPNINITQEGTYTLKVKTATNCEFTKKYIVTKYNKPSYFNVSNTICTFIINGQKEINIKNYTKNYITAGNNFEVYSTINDLNQAINSLEIVTLNQVSQTFYVLETNTNGCKNVSQITILVNFPSVLSKQILCQNNNDFIDISDIITNTKANYPNHIIKFYTNLNDAENGVNELQSTKINNTVRNLYVAIQEKNGSCYQNLIIPVEISSVFNLPNENKTICKNEQIVLEAPTGLYTYLWNTGATTSNITVTQIGTYNVTITNANGCSFQKTFIVNQSQSAQIIDVKINQFANVKNSVTVIVAGSGDFEYSLDGINYQKSNYFTLVKSGAYIVYVKDPNGCGIATQSILVLDIPNFFTPNGDGINDTWNVSNLFSVFPDAEIYILDRYGKLVSYLYPHKPEWNGIAFGQKQPSTDYWYVIKLNNGNTYKGHFSLKR